MSGDPQHKRLVLTALAAVVTLVTIAAAAIFVLAFADDYNNTAPMVTSLLTVIGTAVPAILALATSERTRKDLHNGVVKDKLKEAVEELHRDEGTPGL